MCKLRYSLVAITLIGLLLMTSGCFQIIDQNTYNPAVNISSTAVTNSPNKFIAIITGAYAGERFGASIAAFNNVDGAGHQGIAVGAIASGGPEKSNSGSVYVISFINLQTRYRLDGQKAGDQFGHSLATVGDLNGDQIFEFIVGAPAGDVEGFTDAGYVGLYSGRDGKRLGYYPGDTNNLRLGHSLAGLGDINGDRIPDFGIGTPFSEQEGKINAGMVVLELSHDLPFERQPLKIWGEAAGDNFGWSIAGIGDVSGDGIPDIAIGAPGVKLSNGTNVGRVYILSGNGGTTLYKIDGTESEERFGFSVVGLDDIDGDKFPDFVVGAPAVDLSDKIPADTDDQRAGKAYVFSGKNGNLIFKLEGFPQGNLFGFSLAGRDVDGDGFSDIMVGDPSAGQGHGSVHIFSGKDGKSLYIFINQATRKDAVGSALNCEIDINRDGCPDVIVGAYSAPNIEARPTGMVFVLSMP